MIKIAICVFEAAKEKIFHRKKSFELYGFDFLVDTDFNVWILEINQSPAMAFSTVFYSL